MPFRIALSGLNAATSDLNVTANNIANSNTTGFKASRTEFSDVFTASGLGSGGTAIGNGVRVAAVTQQFGQGAIQFTNNNLDLAISGEGFFTLLDPTGYVYTRNGAFGVDREGYIVNSANQKLQVYPAITGSSGQFNTGTLTDLRLQTSQSAPQATSSGEILVNLPANTGVPSVGTFDPTDPQSFNYTTSAAVYDSLGTQSTATFYFVKTANPNEWQVAMTIDGTQVGGLQTLQFSDTGTLTSPASGEVTFPTYIPTTGAAPLDITFDFAQSTQYGGQFAVSALNQDGYSAGRLTSIDISDVGVVFARFTNGRAIELGQVALSNFPNPQGLRQIGDSSWAETFAAGNVIRGEAGSASFGLIQAGALEGSTVDLTQELVNMITSQRTFQANAQMISTADQITQTIINIR